MNLNRIQISVSAAVAALSCALAHADVTVEQQNLDESGRYQHRYLQHRAHQQ